MLVGLMVVGSGHLGDGGRAGHDARHRAARRDGDARTDPYRYLIAPRLWAAVIALPVLVLVANSIGIFGGYLLATGKLDFNAQNYLSDLAPVPRGRRYLMSLVKAGVFGFIMALMGCYDGFHTQGGAAGVGASTTNAVVSSFVLILLANLLITVMAFG